MASIDELAPSVQLHLYAEFDRQIAERMRYQEIDFVIDYARCDDQGFQALRFSKMSWWWWHQNFTLVSKEVSRPNN